MKGYIYKITDASTINNLIYIGSTMNLVTRYANHKTNLTKNYKNSELYNLLNNMVFEILEEVEYSNKDELLQIEGGYIRKYIEDDNYTCLNKRIAWRSKKQYCKDNKHILNERSRKPYFENKENLVIYYKQYYQRNKEQIKTPKKELYAQIKNKNV